MVLDGYAPGDAVGWVRARYCERAVEAPEHGSYGGVVLGRDRYRKRQLRATTFQAGPAVAVALLTLAGCTTAARQDTTAPPSGPASTPSSADAPAAPTSPGASAALDASKVLPTAADLGPDWGTASNQDHAAEGSLVYLWALTHCVRLSSLATGSGKLDGPAFDSGFAALAHRVPWVALSNNPDLARTGQFQEQDVITYAGPADTYAAVTSAMRNCSTSPTPSRTVDLQPVAPPTVPPGLHVTAYRYSLGEMLAEVVVLGDQRQSVVADVEDAASTAGQQADPNAKAALVRTTLGLLPPP